MGVNSEREDEMWLAWQEAASKIYDNTYYKKGSLVARVNDAGHVITESKFGPEVVFKSVLEVGAGTGRHFSHVTHQFDKYVMTDVSEKLLDIARDRYRDQSGIAYEVEDATNLSYPDNTFDRLISIYNLEHLPNPHLVLREWRRVLRPGGTLSIAIPLDGGVAWRLGRFLTTRKSFARVGLDLDYIIAREHINPSYNLISLIRHYFPCRSEEWYPFRIKLVDLNLVFCCSITV